VQRQPGDVVKPEPGRATTELLLSMGGVVGHFGLDGAPGPFVAQLMERYGPYAIPVAPWVQRTFSVRVSFAAASPMTDPRIRAGEVAARPLRVEETDALVRISRWDFSLTLGAVARPRDADAAGEGAGAGDGSRFVGGGTCQMNPFAFDSMLRVLWATFLPRAGGALFHACAFRIDERGVIFPGESGAGKSTLARKLPDPERILTDELVAVSRGPIGQWRISGTPFWGEFQRGGGSLRSWPLAGVAFLEQSSALDARAIAPAEAAFRLLACLLCFRADADTAARNLAIAIDVCKEVPCLVLQTRRESTIESIERTLAPHLEPAGAGPGSGSRRRPRLGARPSAREMISEFRWFLKARGRYAFTPRGSSMKPWLRDGDSLFVESTDASRIAPGDIVLYWTPGRRPEDDRLTCHRMVARRQIRRGPSRGPRIYVKGDALSAIERFDDGRESEVLGRVSAVSRDGRAIPVPGRVGNLARLAGSLVATPFLKMVGR
jgi:hypothetical protein